MLYVIIQRPWAEQPWVFGIAVFEVYPCLLLYSSPGPSDVSASPEHLCCYWRLSLSTFVEFCCCTLYMLQLAHHIHCVSGWSSTRLNRIACVKNWHVISFFYSWNRTFCRVVSTVHTRQLLSCQHWLSSVSVVPQIKEQENVLSFMNASFVILWSFKIRIFQSSW